MQCRSVVACASFVGRDDVTTTSCASRKPSLATCSSSCEKTMARQERRRSDYDDLRGVYSAAYMHALRVSNEHHLWLIHKEEQRAKRTEDAATDSAVVHSDS